MLQPTDYLLINRGDQTFKVESSNLMATIEDSDWLLINRSDTTYKISGADVRQSLNTGNPLSPALPPFGGLATTETVLASADGKVEFSLDGTNYSTNLTVPLNTFYYVDWGTDILSAAHGSSYSAQITATYSDLGTSNTIDFDINAIDKLPDPFSFTGVSGATSTTQYESDIVSPVKTINAPASIWVTSDAPAFELRVGDSTWFDPPAVPGTAYVSPNQEVQVRHTTGTGALTAYTTTVHIGYGTGAGENESASFVTTTLNVTYDPITLTSVGGTNINRENAEFTSSTASGTNIDHVSTDWQVATDAGFTNIVQQSLNDTTNLTSWSTSGLVEDQVYYVRVRYNDSSGISSSYSSIGSLTARSYYFWRLQVRISSGGGGAAMWNGSVESESLSSGSSGRSVIQTVEAHYTAPGSVDNRNGSSGSLGSGGAGAFGFNGGSAPYNGTYGGGGGGGAGAWRLNSTYMAAVGGGGGRAPGGNTSNFRGGNGGGINGNGSKGNSPAGENNSSNGGTVSSSGGSGGNGGGGVQNASGGGGGGFAPGGGGTVGDDARSQGGGGGAGWGQSTGTIIDGWEVVTVSDLGGSTLVKQRAPYSSPTSWSTVSTLSATGNRSIASI